MTEARGAIGTTRAPAPYTHTPEGADEGHDIVDIVDTVETVGPIDRRRGGPPERRPLR